MGLQISRPVQALVAWPFINRRHDGQPFRQPVAAMIGGRQVASKTAGKCTSVLEMIQFCKEEQRISRLAHTTC